MIVIVYEPVYDWGFKKWTKSLGVKIEEREFQHRDNWSLSPLNFKFYYVSPEDMNLLNISSLDDKPFLSVKGHDDIRLYGIMTGYHLGIDPEDVN